MIHFVYQLITACFLLFVASHIEPLFFPVVMNFVTTSGASLEAGYTIQGYMNKVRDCEFIAVTVMDQDKVSLPMKFKDNPKDDRENRPTGSQPFGPWVIQLRKESYDLKLTAIHKCHPMWTTATALGTINVYTQK